MAIYDLFSKRQRRVRGGDDVYRYDILPANLKVQLVHVWDEVLGTATEVSRREGQVHSMHEHLVMILRKERGVFVLPSDDHSLAFNEDFHSELRNYFLQEDDVERSLDVVELTCRAIDVSSRNVNYLRRRNANELASEALQEINDRFKENVVGFAFNSTPGKTGSVFRIDSQLLHEEVVKPALHVLQDVAYAGPEQEFLSAHEHFRRGESKAALYEALKALESTLKVICAKRGWTHQENATCATLIGVVLTKELIPAYWQSHFTGLRATLESGVPTARNRDSGHGQGVEIKEVPTHLAAYVLHQAAAAIVFLAEAEKAMG